MSEVFRLPFISRFAFLSIGAAIITIVLKSLAFFVTGSMGFFSDVLESFVNLMGAIIALLMLTIAARPPDEHHAYGHTKAEYFSSGIEGILIVIAAGSILGASLRRLIYPINLEGLSTGIVFAGCASIVNLVVAIILFRAGKRYQSITLEANAQHLLCDVWTTAGVILGVIVVYFTRWLRVDPLIALIISFQVLLSGLKLVKRTISGLMDEALPMDDQKKIMNVLDNYRSDEVEFHSLRTRRSGAKKFISFHVLTPGHWTVQHGHEFLECIEADLRKAIPNASIFTHLESMSDPSSWDDPREYKKSSEENIPRS